MPMALCASAGDDAAATNSARPTSMNGLCASCEASLTPYLQMCMASHLLCTRDLLPAQRPLFGTSMLCAQHGITYNLAGRNDPLT